MRFKALIIIFILCASISGKTLMAQDEMSFTDISFKLGESWSETGNVLLDPIEGKHETLDGSGILLNYPDKRHEGADIYSNEEFGDLDLSFDFLMFPGSNSGIYLQGNYEIQLRDSWGVINPTFGDNGGIYERWTEEGTGYEGRPPLQNAARAPGVWQHMDISFTAPDFDESGAKISNARISVSLNGVPVQTDVEMTGPTRGAASAEKSRGPIRIQGDHGAVAFRDMVVTSFDNPDPEIKNITYTTYKGQFNDSPEFGALSSATSGKLDVMTPEISPSSNEFLIRFTGTLEIETPGAYTFEANFPGGNGALLIDGEPVISYTSWSGDGTVTLNQGSVPIEVQYAKIYEWVPAGLSVRVEGPGIRMTELADPTVNVANVTDPIYLDAPNVLRSFMDIPDEGRVVRAVSVGSSQKVHFTYDMDNGSLVHAWRGEFLNTTPMWNDRGDGSSRPRGSVCYLDGREPPVQPMTGTWKSDTAGLDFQIKGYRKTGKTGDAGVTFMYSMGNNIIEDHINAMTTGKGVTRRISSSGNAALFVRLGHGEEVSEIARGVYRVAGRGNYYIELDDSIKAEIRLTPDGEMELLAPLGSSLTYSILF